MKELLCSLNFERSCTGGLRVHFHHLTAHILQQGKIGSPLELSKVYQIAMFRDVIGRRLEPILWTGVEYWICHSLRKSHPRP